MAPRWTESDLAAYERKQNRPENRSIRPRSVVQKQQDDSARKIDNVSKKPAMDGASLGDFSLSVEFLISDDRDRDGDGMLATVLDTYLAALGRLLKMDRQALRNLAKSVQRSGGRKNHNLDTINIEGI